jgi:hypothetical protein
VVAHHLAKVRVASSNLVIRSSEVSRLDFYTVGTEHGGVAEWSGTGLQSRLHGFESRRHLTHQNTVEYARVTSTARAVGAAVARFPDTEEVAGSIPVPPTDEETLTLSGSLLFCGSSRRLKAAARLSWFDPSRRPNWGLNTRTIAR